MTKAEIAARLLVLENRIAAVQSELKVLFQDVLDNESDEE